MGVYSAIGCTAESSRVESGAWWWHCAYPCCSTVVSPSTVRQQARVGLCTTLCSLHPQDSASNVALAHVTHRAARCATPVVRHCRRFHRRMRRRATTDRRSGRWCRGMRRRWWWRRLSPCGGCCIQHSRRVGIAVCCAKLQTPPSLLQRRLWPPPPRFLSAHPCAGAYPRTSATKKNGTVFPDSCYSPYW